VSRRFPRQPNGGEPEEEGRWWIDGEGEWSQVDCIRAFASLAASSAFHKATVVVEGS